MTSNINKNEDHVQKQLYGALKNLYGQKGDV